MAKIKKQLAQILKQLDSIAGKLEDAGFKVEDLDVAAIHVEEVKERLGEL